MRSLPLGGLEEATQYQSDLVIQNRHITYHQSLRVEAVNTIFNAFPLKLRKRIARVPCMVDQLGVVSLHQGSTYLA